MSFRSELVESSAYPVFYDGVLVDFAEVMRWIFSEYVQKCLKDGRAVAVSSTLEFAKNVMTTVAKNGNGVDFVAQYGITECVTRWTTHSGESIHAVYFSGAFVLSPASGREALLMLLQLPPFIRNT